MAIIALTGATGFVGGATLGHLLSEQHSVRALLRPGRSLQDHARLEVIPGSLDDPDSLENLVARCDAVIHVAGAISGRDYADFARTNVAGCSRLVQAMQAVCPDARLVHVSSLAAREPGLSDYAASKRAGEEIITASELDWAIIRPPAVYGPEDRALAPLWRLLARGFLPRIGSPQSRFSLLHVEDLAAALVASAVCGLRQSSICCLHDGTPGGFDWPAIAKIARERRGKRVWTVPLPRFLLDLVAWLGLMQARIRKAKAPVLVPGKVRELAHPDWVCDNTELPGCPEWKPIMRFEHCLTDLPGWSRYEQH